MLLEVAVQDQAGRFVKGIEPTRFSLREGGVPEARPGPAGRSRRNVLAPRRREREHVAADGLRAETAATLVDYMSPLDRMVIAPFAKSLLPVTGPTADRQTILEAIAAIRPGGGTAKLNVLAEMSGRLGSAEGRRAMVLLTDGYDEHSTTSMEQALAAAKQNQVTVYVIAIGGVAGISLKGERALRTLATDTGGRRSSPRPTPTSRPSTRRWSKTSRIATCSPTRRATRPTTEAGVASTSTAAIQS